MKLGKCLLRHITSLVVGELQSLVIGYIPINSISVLDLEREYSACMLIILERLITLLKNVMNDHV